MRLLFTLFFIFLIPAASFASVTIQCDNPKYAGQKLSFYSYSDPVSSSTKLVFSLEFDKTGKCTKTVETQTTDFVFCDFGIYRGLLFLEPNQTIKLQLPPPREKTFADQKNPYFEPVSFWFATENKQQICNLVSDFTTQLNQLTDKYFDQLYFRQSKPIYDSLIYFIDKKFSVTEKENTLILESEGKIVWLIGERIDNRFRITDSTKRALIIKASGQGDKT